MKKIMFIIIFLYIVSCISYAQEKRTMQQEADDKKFQQGLFFLSINEKQKALNEFYEYLDIYVDGLYRAKAYRFIAAIYFDNSNFTKAIAIYKRLFEEFPLDDDGMYGLLQIGICYSKMGFDEEASKTFTQLMKEFPDSSYAKDAVTMLELLKIAHN
ncbi:MAG TPA: tetratricopeptide repeat protein [Spirochaetota bacterium]|nr:tetratricopeptide repeat protein [Spirochaetota bacterium]